MAANILPRLAFLCHPYHRGGVTRWMADAAAHAARIGHEVYFVTVVPRKEFYSSGGRETMVELVRATAADIRLVTAVVGRDFEFGTDYYKAHCYRSLILSHVPPGTAIIVSDDMAAWHAAAAVADHYPMVGVLHGDQDYYYDRAAQHVAQLSVCVCVSGRVKRNLLERLPDLDAGKVHVIPCGINLPAHIPVRDPDPLTRLVFVGRLTDYEKRAYDLVAICEQLHAQNHRFHLDIAGNSAESALAYGRMFAEKGLAGQVTFHGWQTAPQVQQLLFAADMLLLTSNSEGMPLVMMEALAAGCAFVGTRVSGIEDYENDAAVADCFGVYPVGDTAAAAAQIVRLAATDMRLRRRQARSLAEREFGMDVCINRYMAAITVASTRGILPLVFSMGAFQQLSSRLRAGLRSMKMALRS